MKKSFGLIGHPLGHSMSAVMHNAVFKKLKLDCTYKLFDLEEKELDDFFKNLKLDGLNVTIPYKTKVQKYLNKVHDSAELIGSVNTIKNGKIREGFTTDGLGCIKAFENNGVDLEGKKILILGAGGATRSIIFELLKKGDVMINNRTKENADKLINEVKEKVGKEVEFVSNEELSWACKEADILINTTSVGMHPLENEIPVNPDFLQEKLVVMDIVYNPIKTMLLRKAEEHGCKAISGVDMLVFQGAEALKIWLGINPPIDVMRKAVIDKLTELANK